MWQNETENPVFVFMWEIENFSYCGHKKGNFLVSPRFTVHNLDNTSWNLICYPRGDKCDKFIGVYLERADTDNGPSRITIAYEIGLVSTTGSINYLTNDNKHWFRKGHGFGTDELVAREEVLRTQRSTLLPDDTLTFRCRIWKRNLKCECPTFCFALTCIGVQQSFFNCTIPNFSSFHRNQRKTFSVYTPSKENALVTMDVFLNNDDKIQIDITGSSGRNYSRQAKLKVILLDTNGRTEIFVRDEHLFTSKEQIWSFITTFARPDLLKDKIRFLPNDELTMQFYCNISDGIECSRINRSVDEVPSDDIHNVLDEGDKNDSDTDSEPDKTNSDELNDKAPQLGQELLTTKSECTSSGGGNLETNPDTFVELSKDASSNLNAECSENASESSSKQDTSTDSTAEDSHHNDHCDNPCSTSISNLTSDSLNRDLLCLYHEGTLSDFTLKVSVKTFHAHKAVLCARSPVFKAMLTSNMKETVSHVMDISDLDVDTVSRMLNFIYTDAVGDLEWEAATRLYFAADKYGITALKRLCTGVLKSSLCVANVGGILALADMHVDGDLKEAANDFIFTHDTEVMCSVEWRNFMQKEVQLAAETMHLMYMKKSGNIK